MNLEQLVDFRLGSVDVRAREWLRKNTIRIAKQTYGSVFIGQAQAKNMSDRYIKSIKFHLKGANTPTANLELTFDVKSYKTDDGKPLYKWFEHGTKKHWIYPKFKKALRWQKAGGTSFAESSAVNYPTTPQTYMSEQIGAGESVYAFSKGHQVSGIQATNIMRDMIENAMPQFKQEIATGLERFYKESEATWQ